MLMRSSLNESEAYSVQTLGIKEGDLGSEPTRGFRDGLEVFCVDFDGRFQQERRRALSKYMQPISEPGAGICRRRKDHLTISQVGEGCAEFGVLFGDRLLKLVRRLKLGDRGFEVADADDDCRDSFNFENRHRSWPP